MINLRKMWVVIYFVVVLFYVIKAEAPPSPTDTFNELYPNQTVQAEKKLSETIMAVLKHYKQPDPLGIPGAPIPDPMPLKYIEKSFSLGRMNCTDMKLYGLKNFRIDHIYADITQMRVEATLSIDVLTTKGNYTLKSLFSRGAGPFTVKLHKVVVTAIATMEVQVDGTLEAQDMDMDIHNGKIELDFQGMGMLQGAVNSMGTVVFDSIKPFVLREASTNMRAEINKQTKNFPKKFPNSISPFDELVYEIRHKVRSKGFDPYLVPDYNNSAGILDVSLTNTWLYGLASFYRTKDIKIELRNKTIHALLEVGTGQLKGTSNWEVSLVTGMLSRYGAVAFSVEYIRVQVNVSQSMDTSHPPSMDDIQLELGNIQVRFDGLGTVDYFIEFGVNVIPNLLRYQIMDAIEKPIKYKIQDALNQVNVEKIVMENAEQIDSGKGFDNMQLVL